MIPLLPDLYEHVISYLNRIERCRSQRVCRRWRRVCQAHQERLDVMQWNSLKEKYDSDYPRRCQKRQNLQQNDAERLDILDDQLSALLVQLESPEHATLETCQQVKVLLNQGATASKLRVHELDNNGNLGDHVDSYLEWRNEKFDDTPVMETMFQIWMELVCSPCTSWRYHRRYAGNGGIAFPHFVAQFSLFGSGWGNAEVRGECLGLPQDRDRAYWLCRLMMYAARKRGEEVNGSSLYSRLIPLPLPTAEDRDYCNFLLFPWMNSSRQLQKPTNSYFICRFLEALISVLSETTTADISRTLQSLGEYWWAFLLRCSIEDEAALDWSLILSHKTFLSKCIWGEKSTQQYLYHCLEQKRSLRLAFLRSDELLQQLCRRKDRKCFELLVRHEAYTILAEATDGNSSLVVDNILFHLQHTARGKTERLIWFFSNLKATRDQRGLVLQELVQRIATKRNL